jgi:uncharacterized protein (TIGR02996 family)
VSNPPGTRPPRDTGRTYNSVTRNLIYGSWASPHHPDQQPPPVEEHPWTVDRVPADPAAHLIYADWLDEQGEGPRADLVRVRCRLRELPPFEGVVLEREPTLRRTRTRVEDSPWGSQVVTAEVVLPWQDLPPRVPVAAVVAIGLQAKDEAFALRFGGREAPYAIPDGKVKALGGGLLRVRFVLYPFMEDGRVCWVRPYDDPHEAERLTLRRRERELRALLVNPPPPA